MMYSDHIDMLWDFLTTGQCRALVDQLRAEVWTVTGMTEVGPTYQREPMLNDPQQLRNRTSFAPGEGSSSATADSGTAGVGRSLRYFVVQLRDSNGRQHEMYLEAADRMHASQRAMFREPSAVGAKVVREIDRETFERVTGVRPQ